MHILLANTQFVNTKIEFILKKTVSFIKTNSFTYSNFYKKRVFSMTLDEIRKRIDAIDEQLLPLFIERMKCAQDVAQAKRELSLPIFNAQRENEILTRVAAEAGDFAPEAKMLYTTLMALNRSRQHKLLNSGTDIRDEIQTALQKETSLKEVSSGKKIAFQGVPGSFSHAAATFLFPDCDVYPYESFKDVFEALKNGTVDFGLLPVENSSAGSVVEVYDLILNYRFSIVGSTTLHVHHCLAAPQGVAIENIRTVYSHPQALAQCSDMISSHNWKSIQHSNTAVAAKMLAKMDKENGVTDAAAICSTIAANMYGLDILQEDIQNNNQNRTRFAALSKEMIIPKNAEKISLCFSLPHTTGSLYSVLARFAMTGLNLTKIESRPLKEGNNGEFKYNFYLDFTGNVHHCDTLDLLCSLSQELPNFSFLGNYVEYDPNDEH